MSKPHLPFQGSAPWRREDRRSGRDRRGAEGPPPAGRERRVGLEPRQPEMVELEFTPSEWAALHESADPLR